MKDLCARLHYGVKIAAVISNGEPNTIGGYCDVLEDFYIKEVDGWFNVSMIKPYLRPISSMTEEEKKELSNIRPYLIDKNNNIIGVQCNSFIQTSECQDWLNSHHFDYRGLIKKGLALEAPEDMYKDE